jgi:YhcH/YjgK/YiaL family protein
MIHDKIKNWERYSSVHPLFKTAFEHLINNDILNFPEGQYNIKEKEVSANVAYEVFKTKDNYYLETHKEYIDIQVVLKGSFEIGLRFLDSCNNVKSEYNAEKDIVFYSDEPLSKINLFENEFLILFPEDAHLPYPPKESVIKVIYKVKI